MIKIIGGIVVVIIITIIFIGRNSSDNEQAKPVSEEAKIPVSGSATLIAPKEVVENYMKSTLGTITGAKLDYEQGKTYLAEKLKKQFIDDSFIPTSYGIQNGPDNIEIESEEINGDKATVAVEGIYGGETGTKWQFDLIKEAREWKIVEIMNLSQ